MAIVHISSFGRLAGSPKAYSTLPAAQTTTSTTTTATASTFKPKRHRTGPEAHALGTRSLQIALAFEPFAYARARACNEIPCC